MNELTPKGEATRLCIQFSAYIKDVNLAKQCALICVKEIQNEITDPNATEEEMANNERAYYWLAVEKEIEKL